MKAQTQRALRKYHHYIGVFLAPAILLFSISGAVQTFRLNEEKGWGGTPPNWMVWIASVHKDQTPPREKSAAPKSAAPNPAAAMADDHDHAAPSAAKAPAPAKRPSPLPLKIFVVLMAVGLIVSTLLGVTIALNNRATRRVSILMLVAGAVLPIVLLWV
ncbi:hypothetical protein BH10PSE14_BH10PSE14_31160 [soil metagenome]